MNENKEFLKANRTLVLTGWFQVIFAICLSVVFVLIYHINSQLTSSDLEFLKKTTPATYDMFAALIEAYKAMLQYVPILLVTCVCSGAMTLNCRRKILRHFQQEKNRN
jgi:hypothetical protein